MSRPALSVLIVEDNEDDATLLLRELGKNFELRHLRVDTAEAMRSALSTKSFEVVLSDYAMPEFDAMRALEVLRESGQDLPFIVVSGTIGEETAIAALKAGAHDFVVKGRTARLIPAIERECREAESRRKRRIAEQQLRDSELKYRRIVETTREGIWMIDERARTTYVNLRMAAMLGAAPEALIGRAFLDFVASDWQRVGSDYLERQHEGPADQHDLKLRRGDGDEFWVTMSTAPITDEQGHYEGALAMVTDTTEQRKLQAQLMMSDRLASVGMLAAGVAHEINNPLAALAANVDLALGDLSELGVPATDSKLQQLLAGLRDAQESARRLRQIVRDIKLFSAPEKEKRTKLDVRDVLETTLRMASNEVRHRAKLVRDYEPVPAVEANEARLGQVFLNLVVNSAQAIPEGQAAANEIRVVTKTDDKGRVVVEVRDTGTGIEPEIMNRLFIPFFTTKQPGEGTGLGLSICHRTISALGGHIEVESQPGKGSVFRVLLPSLGTAAVRPPPESAPPVVPAVRRGRVLVIDDETMIVNAAVRTLQDHDVATALSGGEALEYLRGGERYDVIICDLMMPQMTGIEVFEEIRQLAPDQAKRIIFLTGGAFTPRARAFLEEVDNECMEKPFEPAGLRAAVNARVR